MPAAPTIPSAARLDYLSWGRTPRLAHHVERPRFPADAPACVARAGGRGTGPARGTRLAYGMGRSYGDSCLNGGGTLVDTRDLDRLIAFDPDSGTLEVEAGVTLDAILRAVSGPAPGGGHWFLPVTPGTRQVTVGGAIANDVHGKNHHREGCFGAHVSSVALLGSDGAVRTCGPSLEADRFAATIGGLGLTGIVLSATLRLRRVPSLWLETEDIRFDDLAAFHRLSEESLPDWEYTVAWIDCLARGRSRGRGIFSRARHARIDAPVAPARAGPAVSVPFDLPRSALNAAGVGAFNALYWRRVGASPRHRSAPYDRVLYPLDGIGGWNRIYGRAGFHQFQCVVPAPVAPDAIGALLRIVSDARQGSFLAVLKTLGDRPSRGTLSFPMRGTTLALDFPDRGAPTAALLDRLHAVVVDAGGRMYPAKDGRMSAATFEAGFPGWRAMLPHVDPGFSSSFWRRVSRDLPAGRA